MLAYEAHGFKRKRAERKNPLLPRGTTIPATQMNFFTTEKTSMIRTISLFLALSTLLAAGESRTWKNTDGSKHFEAEFVSREGNTVTLIREDGKELTFDLDKLHEEDRGWLNHEHPIPGTNGSGPEAEVMPDADAMFDTLKFGDDRNTVSKKLAASTIVESGVAGVFQGRTGLNGIYRTKHKIGGLVCFLFFDWTESGQLQEVTLQTENRMSEDYEKILKPCWEECIPLITSLHGNPMQKMGIPKSTSLEDGQMLASHLWKLEHGGTVMLGTARMGRGYQVVVRFTTEKYGQE